MKNKRIHLVQKSFAVKHFGHSGRFGYGPWGIVVDLGGSLDILVVLGGPLDILVVLGMDLWTS